MIFPLRKGESQTLLRAFVFHFYSSIIVRRPLEICVLRTNMSNYWLCALSLQGLDVVNTQPMPPAFHLVSSVRWHHTCVCSCPASLHKAAPVCRMVQMGLKEQGWALLTQQEGEIHHICLPWSWPSRHWAHLSKCWGRQGWRKNRQKDYLLSLGKIWQLGQSDGRIRV